MQSDKKVHELYKLPKSCTNAVVKKSDVLFSTYWIEINTTEFMLNPVNDIQFKHLMRTMQEDIKKRRKKPLFDEKEENGYKLYSMGEEYKPVEDTKFRVTGKMPTSGSVELISDGEAKASNLKFGKFICNKADINAEELCVIDNETKK